MTRACWVCYHSYNTIVQTIIWSLFPPIGSHGWSCNIVKMLIFQQHTSKNQKQVYEYKKVLQSGRQGTAPSHGGPQKQDPTSHTAGEEGESVYHFEIQLLLLFIERVWQNKTVTVNKIRLCIQAMKAKRNQEEQKGSVTLNEMHYLDGKRQTVCLYL